MCAELIHWIRGGSAGRIASFDGKDVRNAQFSLKKRKRSMSAFTLKSIHPHLTVLWRPIYVYPFCSISLFPENDHNKKNPYLCFQSNVTGRLILLVSTLVEPAFLRPSAKTCPTEPVPAKWTIHFIAAFIAVNHNGARGTAPAIKQKVSHKEGL